MDIRKIGRRNIVFTFYDLGIGTNVSVIVTARRFFIIDSYLGPESMAQVDSYLLKEYGERDYLLINTHSDWDHIWGNCYFEDVDIVGHELIYGEIDAHGERALREEASYKRGRVVLSYPNLVFDNRLVFPEEGIEIFYSPGHTVDSISVIDRQDEILYVGDNIEGPIPYVQSKNLLAYIRTLEHYLDLGLESIVGGHTGLVGLDLVERNLAYLRDLYRGKVRESDELGEVHRENLDFLDRPSPI